MKRLAVIFVALSLAHAHAEPAGAQAETLFRQGRDLMAANKLAEACSAFEESQKLEAAVTTLINLAGCREKLGQLATAWGLFLDAERETRSASDASSRQLHDVAADRAKKLEPRVSKLAINVPQQSQVDGLEITRGKDRIDSVMWNRALPIDGGTYTITARGPGSSPWSTEVTVGAEGDTKTVDIPDLRNLARDLAPKPDKPSVPSIVAPPPPSEAHPSKLVPIVVGIGAVAALGGGLAFELSGSSTYNDAKAEMTDQARRDSLENSANKKRYIAESLAVVGIAGAGVAVWLFLRHPHETHATARVELVPTGTGLALTGSY